MGKKCVRWARPVLAALSAIIAVSFQWSIPTVSAQSTDPFAQPKLAFADLTYLGGFRLPNTSAGDSFSFGGNLMAYNPARNSLFINSLAGKVAEVAIPAPVSTADVNAMPFASYLQPFFDPTEGHFHELETSEAKLAGLLVEGDRLYGTGSVYYDANNSQVLSHFSHSTNLAQSSFIGMSQVWETGKTGYVAGYLAEIPAEWRAVLGGSALTGQCCIPIVTRTSFGPAAFAFNPSTIGYNSAISANPLLYYTETHATLGPWNGANAVYGATTKMGGVAVVAGTRTALFIGRNGFGTFCYGHGVDDPALAGKVAADGEINCYDPTYAAKSQHAYPYRYQIWAYDLADFAAVKAGTKQPWEVVPYATWPFDLPTPPAPAAEVRIGGIGYDSQRQTLYISQYLADRDGYAYRPIIHALKINVPGTSAPVIKSTTVALSPDKTAPQAPGTVVRWSAAASGNQGPYEYKWASFANGTWSIAQDWSTSQTFDWQPAVAATDAKVGVWVRTAPSGSSTGDITADAIAATAEAAFAISDSDTTSSTTTPSSAVTGVTLSSNVPAPQPINSNIIWTATPAGGTGALVYKWFISSDGGGSWSDIGPYSSSNQLMWTPTVVNDNYRIAVWVKRATSADAEAEAKTATFAITTPISTPVSSVTLSSSVAAPQAVSSTIVWTATPSGGSGALVYKWFISADGGGSWIQTGSYSSSNQLTWTPTVANPNYRIAVWVKRATNTTAELEAEAKTGTFAITEPSVTSVALTANLPSPQTLSTTIQWTATPSGGGSAIVYKWFISNDGGASWTGTGAWAASNQLTWTPTAAGANYRVAVWAKRASNSSDSAEAEAKSTTFSIIDRPVTSVALRSSVPSPQTLSSAIAWTATQSGGTGTIVYKWLISSDGGATWSVASAWAASNQFSWTPTAAGANYRVAVWAKRASNTTDSAEAQSDAAFAITDRPMTSVALTSNLASPQLVSSTIVWTATPAGGTGTVVYKWFISEDAGGSWTDLGAYASSNQLIWTPTVANPNYRIAVWVTHASNSSGPEAETKTSTFAITAPLAAVSVPISGIALTSNLAAPQPVFSTIVWTATATGGDGMLIYKWFISEDAGSSWTELGPYASSNQMSWTPTVANNNYRVAVWVKRATNTTADFEAEAKTSKFAIHNQ